MANDVYTEIRREMKELTFKIARAVDAGTIPQNAMEYGGVLMADNRCIQMRVDYYDPATKPI